MRAVVVTVPTDHAELAADALWSLGVLAVEERRGPPGCVELWSSVGDDEAAIDRARAAMSTAWGFTTVELDESVAETWRRFATPTVIDDELVIAPAWWDGELDVPCCVRIEPGASFGLGDHPTTVLTLRAMRALRGAGIWAGAADRPRKVLDVGCGSGVLGIVAALDGVTQVTAIDIADEAVRATADNATRNGVASKVRASVTPVHEISGTYDVVLANVLAPALVSMADDLRRLTAETGALIISGVLAGRYGHVLDALAPMVVSAELTMHGWAAATLAHPTSVRSGEMSSRSNAGR